MHQIRLIELLKGEATLSIEFCYCPPGQYRIVNIPMMGSRNYVVQFTKGFWLQSSLVDLEFYEFVYGVPYYEHGLEKSEMSRTPWSRMDFSEIEDFLLNVNKLMGLATFSFDVPNRAEWDHALLCNQDCLWSWGNDDNRLGDYGWYVENSENTIHKLKEKKSNQWGFYDMYGNLHEYCNDILFDSETNIISDPRTASYSKESVFPCLGGAYDSTKNECAEYRYISYNNNYIEPTGFRLIIR